MKRLSILLLVLAAFFFAAAPANATLRIVALPQTVADIHQMQSAIAGLALNLQAGDSMILYDARARKIITNIDIPNDPIKARLKSKIDLIAPATAALRAYLAFAPPSGVDGTVIDASSFFDEIAPVVAAHSSEPTRIVLIGSPWFTAPGALEGKDYAGSFPSDGLILGDRSQSPIGTLGRRDLDGVTVDYCVTASPSAFLTPEHRDRVERAWGLIIAQRGGLLTTFSSDIKSCLDRFAQAKAPDAKTYTIDQTDAQVFAMYRAKDVAPRIADAAPIKTAPPPPPPANTRQEEAERFTRTARTTPPSTLTGPSWIGIQWHEPVDLDLYVRCSPHAPFLFFGNQLTPEGRHNYDYRAGSGSAFETVDLTQPCPDISKAQILVNFYSGRVNTPITGVVAMQFDGGIYRADFVMPALGGNGGRGLTATGDVGAPFWVKIDVPALLRLNTGAQRRSAR